jgi:hypothetical protein
MLRFRFSRLILLIPLFFAVVLAFLIVKDAKAATFYVSTTGIDNSGCGTAVNTPCRTIPYAIGLANSGDTIEVAAGSYGTGVLSINKGVTLNGPNAVINPVTGTRVAEAIISGAGRWRIETQNIKIQGFTFQNITIAAGGAGFLQDTGVPISGFKLSRNIFKSIQASVFHTTSSSLNMEISENLLDLDKIILQSDKGGFSVAANTDLTITGNYIKNSNAFGIRVSNCQNCNINQNIIENPSGDGIGLNGSNNNVTVSNNKISLANTPQNSTLGGVHFFDVDDIAGPVRIENNIIGSTFNPFTVSGGTGVQDLNGKDVLVRNNCVSDILGNATVNAANGTLNAVNNYWKPAFSTNGNVSHLPEITGITAPSVNVSEYSNFTYTAKVTGATGGMLVSYSISPAIGANPDTGTLTTDAEGKISLSLTNVLPGTYTVTFNPNSGVFPFNRTGCFTASATIQTTDTANISTAAGTPQSTGVNNPFATRLKAQVKDDGNNPVAFVKVNFSAPGSGASGTFSGSTSVLTDETGYAEAPVFTANAIAGSYVVSASLPDFASEPVAEFNLTNTLSCSPLVVSLNSDNGNGGCGTLSFAINTANGYSSPATITFSTNSLTITGQLPVISNTLGHRITLDGGFTVQNGRAVPGVHIAAGNGTNFDALRIGTNVTVKGLRITGFGGYGISILGNNNEVLACWIGTADGLVAAPNGGGIRLGVQGGASASSNSLGLNGQPESGNLISGNNGPGITSANGINNLAYYNWIGYNKEGQANLKNTKGISSIGSQLKLQKENRISN